MQATSQKYSIQLEQSPLLKNSQETFNLQATDLLTEKTFEDLFKRAQNNFHPSYLLARVEYKKVRKGQQNYIFLDGCSLYLDSSFENTRPINVKKVNYFALKCFDTDFEPIKEPTLSDIPLNPSDEGLFGVFITALDPEVLASKSGESQYVIADRLLSSAEDNNDIESKKQQLNEASRWAWCSMKNNTPGAKSLLQKISVQLKRIS